MANPNESPDLKRIGQVTEVLSKVRELASSPEEQKEILQFALQQINKDHPRTAQHSEQSPEALLPETKTPKEISFTLIIEPKAGLKKPTYDSSLSGEPVGRDNFILHGINIKGVLWRRQIDELAECYKFNDQLNKALEGLNSDHFMVDLEFQVPEEQIKTGKSTVVTRLKIREDEEGSGKYIDQAFGETTFLPLDFTPKDFIVSLDENKSPNILTIRAS